MKLGVALEARTVDSLAWRALAAEAAGIDLVWFTSIGGGETALISAAAVAARTSVIRTTACVRVGGHPLAIAEAAAVCDNCSNGRVVLVLEAPENDPDLLAETTDVVLGALSPLPFRHAGPRWRIPANLPENDQPEERIVVTPYTVQTELPVWLSGPAAARVAASRGLSHVASPTDRPEAVIAGWAHSEKALGPAVRRLRRPAVLPLAADKRGNFDSDELVARLRAERNSWGLDTIVLQLPSDLDEHAWSQAIHVLAGQVRPRVTMHELPAGLDEHWKQALA